MKYITSNNVSLFKRTKSGYTFRKGLTSTSVLDVFEKELSDKKQCELFFSDDIFNTKYGVYLIQCCELAIRKGFSCRLHADNIRVFLTSFMRRFLEENKENVILGTTIDSEGIDFDDKCYAVGELKAFGTRIWVHMLGKESSIYNRTCLYVKEYTCDSDYKCRKLVFNRWI